jgi:membrane-bound metal-dependent hydrolase YbcI (DUF457 family)
MPSPLGHAIAGLTVHALVSRTDGELRDPRRIACTVGAALAPDVDLLFQFVDGRNHHGNELHSVGAAVVAAFVASIVWSLAGQPRAQALGAAVAVAWTSHVVLDYLNIDTNPPIGIMALWPFSARHYKCPWPVFLDIGRTLEWATVRHDALAAAWESVLLLPFLALAWRLRPRARV